MNMKIDQLRSNLEKNYHDLFKYFLERKQIVNEIKQVKRENNIQSFFDHDREILLFQKISSQLKQCSLKEVFALSLLIEEHAEAPILYPEWSKGVHLDHPLQNFSLENQINPLLLRSYSQDHFQHLKLNKDFLFLHSV
jgi:chorismate mutase